MKLVVATLCAAFLASVTTTANAAVSIYTYSGGPGFETWTPAAVNQDASLGAPDGGSSTLTSNAFIAYATSTPFTDVDMHFEFSGVTASGTVRLYVGQQNGSGGFQSLSSRLFAIPGGANIVNFASTPLTNHCINIGGCDTFVVQAWSAPVIALDSVLAPNPEPSAWALMIFAFTGVGWRLKAMRNAGAIGPAASFHLPATA